MGDYKKLEVWSLAKDLTVYIYEITESGKISKDFGLRDQIRRSAVSVASNIAEGEESGRQQKAINYLYISLTGRTNNHLRERQRTNNHLLAKTPHYTDYLSGYFP